MATMTTPTGTPPDLNDIASAVRNLTKTVQEMDGRLSKGIDDLETEFKQFTKDATAILANIVDHQVSLNGRLAAIDNRLDCIEEARKSEAEARLQQEIDLRFR